MADSNAVLRVAYLKDVDKFTRSFPDVQIHSKLVPATGKSGQTFVLNR